MTAREPSPERRGSASALLVVGLANPGEEYESSRHNVGGDAVRAVAAQRGLTLKLDKRLRASVATFSSPRGLVTLAVPSTFMNESGAAVAPLVRRASLGEMANLVVVHDELDLEPGRVMLKLGGGLAGHNGLRSIAQVLGTRDFARLRIGIGKPPTKERGADWVLSRLRGARRVERDESVDRAAAVLADLIEWGFEEAQRRSNGSRD